MKKKIKLKILAKSKPAAIRKFRKKHTEAKYVIDWFSRDFRKKATKKGVKRYMVQYHKRIK